MSFAWVGMSDDGNTVTLKKMNEDLFKFSNYTDNFSSVNANDVRVGVAIDIETTGLDDLKDSIIEIGLRSFNFNKSTGEILSLNETYTSFHDPGKPLTSEIIALTGITDDMVKDKNIDWDEVHNILSNSHIIIAHNAAFDRPFIENATTEAISSLSSSKIWGCSWKQVDWAKYGYKHQKLEILSIYHGFFTTSHRALNDVNALLYLLTFPNQNNNNPYFMDIIKNARTKTYVVEARCSPFEKKDLLKLRGYQWNPACGFWSLSISECLLEKELIWLRDAVYGGKSRAEYHLVNFKVYKSRHDLTVTRFSYEFTVSSS